MQQSILFKTRSGNLYLHSPHMRNMLLIHPAKAYLLELMQLGTCLETWLSSLESEGITLKNGSFIPREQLHYYIKKINFLSQNDYLLTVDTAKRISKRLTSEEVLYQLANCDQLTLEVTEACNLDCEYCGYGKFYQRTGNQHRSRKSMDFHMAAKFLDYLVDHWNSNRNTSHNKTIDIAFYGGEPLINFPLIKSVVEYAKTISLTHNQFTFSMTTNGTLLNKYMDFLVANKFSINISLDGNEAHNEYRVFQGGKPSFKSIQANIELLRTTYPDYFKYYINFISVLHKKNSGPEVMQYFKEQYGKQAMIMELNTSQIAPENEKEFWGTYKNLQESIETSDQYCQIRRDFFKELPEIRETNSFLSAYSGYVYNNMYQLMHLDKSQQYYPTATCLPFGKKVYLTVNGIILPCERIDNKYKLGIVKESGVSLDFAEIAHQYNRYYDQLNHLCQVCFNTTKCSQCLFNLPGDTKTECSGCTGAGQLAKYLSHHMSLMEENPKIYSIFMENVNIS
jgi:uncharacterized protein